MLIKISENLEKYEEEYKSHLNSYYVVRATVNF